MMLLISVFVSCNNTTETADNYNITTSTIEQNGRGNQLILKLQEYNRSLPEIPKTRGFWDKLWKVIKTDVYAAPECAEESDVVEAGTAVIANSTTTTRANFLVSIVKTVVKMAQRSYKAFKKQDCAGLSALYIRNEYFNNVKSHSSGVSEINLVVNNIDSLIYNMNINIFINDSLPVIAGNIHNLYLDYAMNPLLNPIPSSFGGSGNSINGGLNPFHDDPGLLPTSSYGIPNVDDDEVEYYISIGDNDTAPDFELYGDETALDNLCNSNIISQSTADVMILFYDALENVNTESTLYSLLNYYITEVKNSSTLLQEEKNEIVLQLEVFRHSYDFWKFYVTN